MVPRRRRRRPWYRTRVYRLARTAAIAAVLVTVGVQCGGPRPSADPAAGGDARPRAGRSASATPTPPPRPLSRSRATTLRVPSLGIEAPVLGLRLGRDRRLETPPLDKPKVVGWFEGGPSPGERGTAVAVGHRDTTTGAAVFAALARVKAGSRVEARRADGRTAVYTVDRVKVFDKARFPDKEVYGPRKRPELRLLTCGGLFDRRTGYTSNVVVFAHLTATR